MVLYREGAIGILAGACCTIWAIGSAAVDSYGTKPCGSNIAEVDDGMQSRLKHANGAERCSCSHSSQARAAVMNRLSVQHWWVLHVWVVLGWYTCRCCKAHVTEFVMPTACSASSCMSVAPFVQ